MKAEITGATGFIGSGLVLELTENDHGVIALTRNPDRAGDRFPPGV